MEAGLLVLAVGARECTCLVEMGVDKVVSGAKENPVGSGCVCPGCRSIWFLVGFGSGYRCWADVAESEQAPAERSSLRWELGGRRLLPQTLLLNYLQQTERRDMLNIPKSREKLHLRTAVWLGRVIHE